MQPRANSTPAQHRAKQADRNIQSPQSEWLIKPKYYIGAGGGTSVADTGVYSLTGTASLSEQDIGLKGFIGVQLNKYFAVEGFYSDLGYAKLKGSNGDQFAFNGRTGTFTESDTIKIEGKTAGLGGVGILPIHKLFSAFVKFGVHWWDVKADLKSVTGNVSITDEDWNVFYGAGIDFNVHKNFAIRTEFECLEFADQLVYFTSSNLVIKF